MLRVEGGVLGFKGFGAVGFRVSVASVQSGDRLVEGLGLRDFSQQISASLLGPKW